MGNNGKTGSDIEATRPVLIKKAKPVYIKKKNEYPTSLSPPLKHSHREIQEGSGRGHGVDQTLSSMSYFQPYQNWDTNLYTIAMQNPS